MQHTICSCTYRVETTTKKIVTFKLAMLIRRSVGLSAWADAFYRSHDVLRKSAFNFPLVEVIDVNVVDAVEEMKWKVIDR